jgi:hypothetical protein
MIDMLTRKVFSIRRNSPWINPRAKMRWRMFARNKSLPQSIEALRAEPPLAAFMY